jgi:hypothetical protein
MMIARFQTLADAYGGDLARWPVDEQAEADAWRAAHPAEALAILGQAAALDVLLDKGTVPTPGPILRDRITASARAARKPVRALIWASATGLMAACAAGLIFGADLSDRLLPDPAAESVAQTATAFDGADGYFDTTTSTTTGSAG